MLPGPPKPRDRDATAAGGDTSGGSADLLEGPHGPPAPSGCAAGGPGVGDLSPPDAADRRTHLRRVLVDAFVVAACVVFTLWQMQPDLLVRDTTPAGGDMGAHVWGPAYLRDTLLPSFQLAGWAPAWYAGFPAYQFYMVVPSLAIVVLNAGASGPLAVAPLAVAVVLGRVAWRRRAHRRWCGLAVAGVVVALLLVGLPYGVAFKWVSVSGVLTLPVAVYAFGRLADLRFPTPAVLSAASLVFLFYRGFTIYGGNIASTLAGEFAFSMALSLAVLYVGVVLRGLRTGDRRALAAVLLALTGLCHLIVAFWALAATAAAVAVRFNPSRAPRLPCALFVLGGLVLAAAGWMLGAPSGLGGLVLLVVGVFACAAGLWLAAESIRWLTPVMVVGGLLSLFWVAPFYLRRAYLNDMGWEKLPYADETHWQHLFPYETPDVDLRWVFALALVGAGLSIGRWLRPGIFLVLCTVGIGVAFVVVPEGRLWNGRLLPFYYLTAMLLAGLAVSEVTRAVVALGRHGRAVAAAVLAIVCGVAFGLAFELVPGERDWSGLVRPVLFLAAVVAAALAVVVVVDRTRASVPVASPAPFTSGTGTVVMSLLGVLVVVGLPLGALPLSTETADGAGYEWPSVGPWQAHASPQSFVDSWARWNYSGYELKDSYREYHGVVETMGQVGQDRGCGRAFWEYEEELDRYGTPMALMLLPFWTDGCIGSMEGLYFEASATTPFHFLTQVELSTNPSAAQRDLPYGAFDIERGVSHLQMLGVKYYMATSDQAVAAARGHDDLTEVTSSGPWVIFEVADSALVEPLDNEPAVLEDVGHSHAEWVEEPVDAAGRFGGPAVRWFVDPSQWAVHLVTDGPDEWQRVTAGTEPEARPVEAAEVSDVVEEDQRITFDVDRVGTPVLVKASYFPNWEASGAAGPYRVAPNLMVVVPTDEHVELTYGRTWVEYVSYGLTAVGLVGLVLLVRRGRYRFRPPRPPAASGAAPPAAPAPTPPGDGDHAPDGRQGDDGGPLGGGWPDAPRVGPGP